MKSLLDPTFRYVPSVQTDIRKTFARIRRELRDEAEAARLERERVQEEAERVVRPMARKGKA